MPRNGTFGSFLSCPDQRGCRNCRSKDPLQIKSKAITNYKTPTTISLNFIRLLGVVITPSVTVERRKRLEAIG